MRCINLFFYSLIHTIKLIAVQLAVLVFFWYHSIGYCSDIDVKQSKDIPLLCSDLPSNAVSIYKKSIEQARRINEKETDIRIYSLRAALINEDISAFFSIYENLAMWSWTENNFPSAKKYIDNFSVLVSILPLMEAEPNSFLLGSGRILPLEPESNYWHAVRQGLRFYENTLRTKHNYLCGASKQECRNSAWTLTNYSLSRELYKDLITKTLSCSLNHNKAKTLWARLERLKAKEALLRLAEKEGLLDEAGSLADQYLSIIRATEMDLYSLHPEMQNIHQLPYISLAEVQRKLAPNELLLVYLQSIECRKYITWRITKYNAEITLTRGPQHRCEASWIKETISSVWEKIQQIPYSNAARTDLENLAEALIGGVSFPRAGGTIYVMMDEGMSGLPFEMLPTPSGSLIGDIYNIKYVPSPYVFARNRAHSGANAKIPYFGIARDTHDSGKLDLSSFVQNMEELAGGGSIPDATIKEIKDKKSAIEDTRILQFITHTTNTEDGPTLVFDQLLTWDTFPSNLQLKADVVLLTACSSIGPDPTHLGEAFSNLSRYFLVSGARNVIATRWNVREEDAKDFTEIFIREFEKYHIVNKAFFEAVREFRSDHPSEPSRWASWILLGD